MNNNLGATKLFLQLFLPETKITIPEYQAPYEWGNDKAEDLLEDFRDFFIKNNAHGYYMGALLFYNGLDSQEYQAFSI
jgi:uncharacterized protein with ParB-like and HNH nuclease domain